MGQGAVPAWNALIADLVHPARRASYFARRYRVIAIAGFMALCGAGWVLQVTQRAEMAWAGFLGIFWSPASRDGSPLGSYPAWRNLRSGWRTKRVLRWLGLAPVGKISGAFASSPG